jgi:hypothetical protein
MRIDVIESIRVEAFGGERPFGFYAPGWAQFIAADHDGTVWAFQQCPLPDRFRLKWLRATPHARYSMLGSCRQEIVNWEDAIYRRRGGLWVSHREAEVDERAERMRGATAGTLWAIFVMSVLVGVVIAVEAGLIE